MNSGFTGDRQAKNDFTASTIQFLERTGYLAPTTFYEQNTYGDLIPYGDDDADPRARIDIYMRYGNTYYAIEIKERQYPSDTDFFIVSGCYYNYEKEEVLKTYQKAGFIPLWVELYPDGIIRLWNVSNIKASELPVERRYIPRYTCVPSAGKKCQERPLLPVSAATKYKRVKSMR